MNDLQALEHVHIIGLILWSKKGENGYRLRCNNCGEIIEAKARQNGSLNSIGIRFIRKHNTFGLCLNVEETTK